MLCTGVSTQQGKKGKAYGSFQKVVYQKCDILTKKKSVQSTPNHVYIGTLASYAHDKSKEKITHNRCIVLWAKNSKKLKIVVES